MLGTFCHHMWLLSLAGTQITAGRGAHPHMQLAVVSITCSCSQVIAFTISSSARLSDRHHVKTVQRQSCWLPHKVFSQRSLLDLAIGSLHVGVFCFAASGKWTKVDAMSRRLGVRRLPNLVDLPKMAGVP